MDDFTPEAAVVTAVMDGRDIRIEFLTNVLGVKTPLLQKSAAELILRVRTADGVGTLAVPIMHPLHCLQSRIANHIKLQRRHDVSRRQLEASPIVLREYISEAIADGDLREAIDILRLLFDYLRSDVHGKHAHKIMTNDPARILDHFAEDARLDPRYRELTLGGMRKALAERRSAWRRMAALFRKPPVIPHEAMD